MAARGPLKWERGLVGGEGMDYLLLAAFTPATTADVAAKAAVTRDISRLALRKRKKSKVGGGT